VPLNSAEKIMNEAIKFKNFTSEDFTWKYDGVPYTFKAGQEMYLEKFKALLFGSHLVDRELNRTGKLTNDKNARAALEVLCFPSDEAVTTEVALDIEEKVKAAKKKGKKKVEKEEEFEDLNN
jgi:hypothetical protein